MKSWLSSIGSLLLLFMIGGAAWCQSSSPRLSDLLEAGSLQYAMPSGFDSAPVIDNHDVLYDFAIKAKSKKLEIRYRIWLLRQTDETEEPNSGLLFEAMLETMALNISNGRPGPVHDYPANSVREEFGADAGATTIISCNSDFGKGYKKCLISVIHKEGVADAYAFFLFDDLKAIQEALMTDKIYHALRFK